MARATPRSSTSSPSCPSERERADDDAAVRPPTLPPLTLLTTSPTLRSTDLEGLTEQIAAEEPLITPARKPQLRRLLHKLLEKQMEHEGQ